MNASAVFVAVLAVLMLMAEGSPVFDPSFEKPPSGRGKYRRRPRLRGPNTAGGYDEYIRICKALNPDPYAFIGSFPYPSVYCP